MPTVILLNPLNCVSSSLLSSAACKPVVSDIASVEAVTSPRFDSAVSALPDGCTIGVLT